MIGCCSRVRCTGVEAGGKYKGLPTLELWVVSNRVSAHLPCLDGIHGHTMPLRTTPAPPLHPSHTPACPFTARRGVWQQCGCITWQAQRWCTDKTNTPVTPQATCPLTLPFTAHGSGVRQQCGCIAWQAQPCTYQTHNHVTPHANLSTCPITSPPAYLQHMDEEYGSSVDASTGRHSGGPFKIKVAAAMRVEDLRNVIRVRSQGQGLRV